MFSLTIFDDGMDIHDANLEIFTTGFGKKGQFIQRLERIIRLLLKLLGLTPGSKVLYYIRCGKLVFEQILDITIILRNSKELKDISIEDLLFNSDYLVISDDMVDFVNYFNVC